MLVLILIFFFMIVFYSIFITTTFGDVTNKNLWRRHDHRSYACSRQPLATSHEQQPFRAARTLARRGLWPVGVPETTPPKVVVRDVITPLHQKLPRERNSRLSKMKMNENINMQKI